jgi:hypothetical protein
MKPETTIIRRNYPPEALGLDLVPGPSVIGGGTQMQGLLDDIAHAEMIRLYQENPDRDDLTDQLRRLEHETFLREAAKD